MTARDFYLASVASIDRELEQLRHDLTDALELQATVPGVLLARARRQRRADRLVATVQRRIARLEDDLALQHRMEFRRLDGELAGATS